MTTLRIRIEDRGRAQIQLGAPVTVRRTQGLPDGGRSPTRTVVVPVGGGGWARLAVEPGRYEIEAVLPSGELLTEEAVIELGQSMEIVLTREISSSGLRGWPDFDRPTTKGGLEPDYYIGYRSLDFGFSPLPRSRLSASMGRVALSSTGDAPLDVERWESWAAWLNTRADLASGGREAPPIELVFENPPEELRITRIPGDERAELLRVSARSREHYFDRPFGSGRTFIAVASAHGVRAVSLPWPWPYGESDTSEVFFELRAKIENDRLICEPSLVDSQLGGLVAYLNAGQMGRAGELLRSAHDALYAKSANPLGAAVGGYVLLSTDRSDAIGAWPVWLHNLTERFPFIPDGPILRARWLLNHDQGEKGREQARHLLLEAFHRGLPYFTAGVAWLIDGLRRFAAKDPDCEHALTIVRGVARAMDMSQAFTSFEFRSPAAPENALPGTSDRRTLGDAQTIKGARFVSWEKRDYFNVMPVATARLLEEE